MSALKFEFTNYNVDVEINGYTFQLDCSSETGNYLKNSASALREIAVAIERGEKTAADAFAFGEEMLDTLLGEGAAEKCFDGRKKRFSDIADMCVWLTQIAAKYQQEHGKKYTNRAQKRAAAKGDR